MSDWLCIIRPPRATFISDMRDDERAVMREHSDRSRLGRR
jgi:hypothetical protein